MPDPNLALKDVAKILAETALAKVAATAPYVAPDQVAAATAKVEAVVNQDSVPRSLRVWSAISGSVVSIMVGVLVTGLMDPAVGDAIRGLINDYTGPFAPVLAALLPVALATLSKYRDPRPTK
jgi:hypothetical protein